MSPQVLRKLVRTATFHNICIVLLVHQPDRTAYASKNASKKASLTLKGEIVVTNHGYPGAHTAAECVPSVSTPTVVTTIVTRDGLVVWLEYAAGMFEDSTSYTVAKLSSPSHDGER